MLKGFLAAGSLALGLVLGCGDSPQPAGGSAPERVPEQEIFAYRLIQSEQGLRSWTLTADCMRRYAGDTEVELDAPRMEFYREGVFQSTLTSQHGRANPQTKDLFAWDDVVVTTVDGKRLETKELRYEHRTGLITNEVFNRFTRGGDVATGFGLVANPSLDYFEIRDRVDAAVTETEAAPEGGSP